MALVFLHYTAVNYTETVLVSKTETGRVALMLRLFFFNFICSLHCFTFLFSTRYSHIQTDSYAGVSGIVTSILGKEDPARNIPMKVQGHQYLVPREQQCGMYKQK